MVRPSCQQLVHLPNPIGIQSYILHHPNRLLRLRDKLVLRPLNLLLGLIAQLMVIERSSLLPSAKLPGSPLDAGLDGIERQPRLLHTLAGARGEREVGVERGIPPGQEAALDLGVLRETSLADALLRQGVLLEGRGQRVLAGAAVLLVQRLAARQAGAGEGVRKGLGLRLGRGRGRQRGLGLGGRGGGREEVDLLADGAAEVGEGLLDVGRVVVGLVGVLGAEGAERVSVLIFELTNCYQAPQHQEVDHAAGAGKIKTAREFGLLHEVVELDGLRHHRRVLEELDTVVHGVPVEMFRWLSSNRDLAKLNDYQVPYAFEYLKAQEANGHTQQYYDWFPKQAKRGK